MLNVVREMKINNLTYLIEEEKLMREKLIDYLYKSNNKEKLKEAIIDLYFTQKNIEELMENKTKLLEEKEMEIE